MDNIDHPEETMTEEETPTAEPADDSITKVESRDLWVSLDADELEDHKIDLLRAMSERDDLDDDLGNFKADYKKKRNLLNKRVAHGRKALEKGEEVRQTICTWHYDPAANTKILRAPDGEVIETKAMTADDVAFVESKLQRTLPEPKEPADEPVEHIGDEAPAEGEAPTEPPTGFETPETEPPEPGSNG